jgi:hypothetical protein
MHFIQLSEQTGVNLAYVVEWHDMPRDPSGAMCVTVIFAAPSADGLGKAETYSRRFFGAEREEFLSAVRLVTHESVEDAERRLGFRKD